MILRLPALRALQHREHQRKPQQADGKLRRSRPVAQRKPTGVNARGKGLHPEIGNRPEIRDCFHDRQQNTGRNRRTGQRQTDRQKRSPRPRPERTGRHKRRSALLQERGTGEQIDIRIQDQHQHQGRATKASDFGKPVIPRPPAHHCPQGCLHDPGMVENAGIGISQHIGRKGQRQNQRNLEKADAGKTGHRHQPRGPHADRKRPCGHKDDQQAGIKRVAPQNRRHELGNRLRAPRHSRQRNGDHRQETNQRQ
mmetsp:Transcript_23540/g.41605  ORF Transcript_23540/g.41605 Transcript_23540/m.41605 type:complete len:253 (-) Transcript_23540:5300-6058(-)